jgi:two-component system, cell cycle response regulator
MKKRDSETTGPIQEVGGGRRRASTGGEAIVVVLQPAGANPGRRHALSRAEHIVGRRAETDIPIDLDSVSRRHARFAKDKKGWFIEDLDSTNGTFVNDEKVEKHHLVDGDIVRFGEAVVKFLSGTNIEVAYHEEIYKLSILDGLTGVHNKRFFSEFLEREVARSIRHGHSLGLIMFDIDHFKKVNDTYGHLAGDAVLMGLTRRLKPRIRREDILARVGGEEFAVVLADTNRAGALHLAEDLRQMVEREPFKCHHDTPDLTVTISLGVAAIEPGDKLEPDELVKKADTALYGAKNGGRNRVVG